MDAPGTITRVDDRQKPVPLAKAKSAQEFRLWKATQDFEAIFLSQMVKQMRRTVPQTDMSSSAGQEVMRSLADEAFAEHLAHTGSIGLAGSLYASLSRQLETSDSTGTNPRPEVADEQLPVKEASDRMIPMSREGVRSAESPGSR